MTNSHLPTALSTAAATTTTTATATATTPTSSIHKRHHSSSDRDKKVRSWLQSSASSSFLTKKEEEDNTHCQPAGASTSARISRSRSSSHTDRDRDVRNNLGFVFTPTTPTPTPPVPLHPQPAQSAPISPKKSVSSPQLFGQPKPSGLDAAFQPVYPSWQLASMSMGMNMNMDGMSSSDDEDDDDDDDREDGMMFAARKRRLSASASGAHLRTRRVGMGMAGLKAGLRDEHLMRGVTTVRGLRGAGETETEMDEVASALPIARAPANASSFPLEQQLISYLFEFSRLLSIVPAVCGTLYNIHNIYHPPPNNIRHAGIDYVVCALWAILTGIQCLALTTGLLTRWQAYYPPLSTLIRLLALQAICWPATHLTLSVLNHLKRPVACWVVIGSTTCVSRSVQLWVTSNLWDHARNAPVRVKGKVGERRWDWGEVGVKCVLPAGLLYFVTAWALILKGELQLKNWTIDIGNPSVHHRETLQPHQAEPIINENASDHSLSTYNQTTTKSQLERPYGK